MPTVPLPSPRNEPVRSYAPGTTERAALAAAVADLLSAAPRTLPMHVGGVPVEAGGEAFDVVAPHERSRVLGVGRQCTADDVRAAIEAAMAAAPGWAATSLEER